MDDLDSFFYSILLIVVVLFLFIVVPIPFKRASTEVITITVEDKERVENNYLVWTKEGEVFEISDSLAYMRFNSSDFYGEIEVGETYNVLVSGWRIPFLSMYRNIIEFK
jgi:hypothetical protein